MSSVPINRATTRLSSDLAEKLPSNIEAERSVLGAILIDNSTPNGMLKQARDGGLTPEDFRVPQNQRIFRNMLYLDSTGQPVEVVSLVENLQQNRELDQAGGAEYVGTLMDGMPRLTNLGYYVKIVKEKSRLRQMVYFAQKLQQDAITGFSNSEYLSAEMETFAKQPSSGDNPAVVVSCKELLDLQLAKADPLIDPLLTRGGTSMLFSWAGLGKSWIATELAYRIAQGIGTIFDGHRGMGGHWPLFGPLKTLYLYGEMHGEKIRERLILIARGNKMDMPENLGVMSKDYQHIPRAPRVAHSWRPCIGPDDKHRKFIEERIFGEGYKLLVLDNISTLWSAAQEEQSKQVAVLKDWFIDLNARGVSVLFLQHAGKSGDFLGDSAQVHILDSYLQLSAPPGYKRKEGLRVIAEPKKIRYEVSDKRGACPFEISLQTSSEFGVQWLTRGARDAQKKAAFEHFKNKMPTQFVGQEVGVSKATAYRWKSEFDENPNLDFHSGSEEEE